MFLNVRFEQINRVRGEKEGELKIQKREESTQNTNKEKSAFQVENQNSVEIF